MTCDDVAVPPSSLGDKMLHLLDSCLGSDVTFIVQTEEIRAHSQILSACSEVLQRQLACGMQETAQKQGVIEDCDPTIFKAFLRYVYSDSFAPLEGLVAEKVAEQASSSAASSGPAADTN